MNLVTACLILSLGLFFCIMSVEGTRCNIACNRMYLPVCGHLRIGHRKVRCTFENSCLFHARSCLTNERWILKPGRCHRDSVRCKLIRNYPGKGHLH